MKKWLRSLGVYVLGVATIPAVLLVGTVTSKNLWSRPHAPKFVDVGEALCTKADQETQFVDFKSDTAGVSATSFDGNALEPAVTNQPLAKPAVGLNFDDAFTEPLTFADNSPKSGGAKRAQRTSDFDGLTFDAPTDSFDAPQRTVPKRDAAKLPNDGIDSLVEQNVSDEQKAKLTTLREKLSELIKTKAELINEQTLTNDIAVIEKQISDLHAAQKLLSAQQILKTMIEEFPQSPAAQKALRMLEAAGVPKSPASKLEPVAEPQNFSSVEPF